MAVSFPPDLIMNIEGAEKSHLIPIARKAVVAGGIATFYVTNDNTATGIPIFNNIYMVMLRGVEVDSAITQGDFTLSADKKTVTIPVKKSSGINVALVGLTLLGAPVAANGSTIYAFIVGD